MSLLEHITLSSSPSLVRHEYSIDTNTDWCFMHARKAPGYRPCFSESLVNEVLRCQQDIRQRLASVRDERAGIHHLVLASDADAFNLGGDLELFSRLIRIGDRGRMLEYARHCVEGAYNFSRLYKDRVHSIAVIQGEALGGGFEAALACQTIIAEEGTGMGFPEVLFDLFPGMGAYTFLTRRVTAAQAERMMLNGRVYSAQELLGMGVIDYVVPRGEGLQAARDLIRRNQRIGNALRSMNTVRDACRPVSLEELLAVTTEWVDAAMRLSERGLKTMERLVRAQERLANNSAAA